MFTGIIESVGRVAAARDLGGGKRLTVEAPFASELSVDQSVAVAGACQTVVACTDKTFDVVAVEETLMKTSLGTLRPGAPVNLERAMRPDGRLDGHLVQGHVDTTLEVAGVRELESSWMISVRYEPEHARYLIPVGSIALDGVSLTIARLEDDRLTVAVIPYTWEHTTLSRLKAGMRINVEFDLIGKYVARSLGLAENTGGLTAEWLASRMS